MPNAPMAVPASSQGLLGVETSSTPPIQLSTDLPVSTSGDLTKLINTPSSGFPPVSLPGGLPGSLPGGLPGIPGGLPGNGLPGSPNLGGPSGPNLGPPGMIGDPPIRPPIGMPPFGPGPPFLGPPGGPFPGG